MGATKTLEEAVYDPSNSVVSRYLCSNCLGVILIIARPESIRWEGRGYLLGDWLLRNPQDVVVDKTHTGRPIRFTASPYALD